MERTITTGGTDVTSDAGKYMWLKRTLKKRLPKDDHAEVDRLSSVEHLREYAFAKDIFKRQETEQALDADIDRIATGGFIVMLIMEEYRGGIAVAVTPDDDVHCKVRAALDPPELVQVDIFFGGYELEEGMSFDDFGIEEGSRLMVNIGKSAPRFDSLTVRADLAAIWGTGLELPQECASLDGPAGAVAEPELNEDGVVTQWQPHILYTRSTISNGQAQTLRTLPASFGDLEMINGTLDLTPKAVFRAGQRGWGLGIGYNICINSLPEEFCSLTICGNLILLQHHMTGLPANFGSLTIGGTLDLRPRKRSWYQYEECGPGLETLPDSFGNITIGGDLLLDGNPLKSLPESFGQLKVGGNLRLRPEAHGKGLVLPPYFADISVGGTLFLPTSTKYTSSGVVRLGLERNIRRVVWEDAGWT